MSKPIQSDLSSTKREAPSSKRPIRVHIENYVQATRIEPHLHTDLLQLLTPSHGIIKVASSDAYWTVPPARGILIPPRFEHAATTLGSTMIIVADIHPSALAGSDRRCRLVNISELTRALLSTISTMSPDYPLDSPASRLVDVLVDQIEAAPSEPLRLPKPADAKLRAITDTLMDKPDDKTTLSHWSASLGISQRTLTRLFYAETGMGFRAYKARVQMHVALGLLATDKPLSQIALDLGYENQSSFIYAFRSWMGISPGRYRSDPAAQASSMGDDECLDIEDQRRRQ